MTFFQQRARPICHRRCHRRCARETHPSAAQRLRLPLADRRWWSRPPCAGQRCLDRSGPESRPCAFTQADSHTDPFGDFRMERSSGYAPSVRAMCIQHSRPRRSGFCRTAMAAVPRRRRSFLAGSTTRLRKSSAIGFAIGAQCRGFSEPRVNPALPAESACAPTSFRSRMPDRRVRLISPTGSWSPSGPRCLTAGDRRDMLRILFANVVDPLLDA